MFFLSIKIKIVSCFLSSIDQAIASPNQIYNQNTKKQKQKQNKEKKKPKTQRMSKEFYCVKPSCSDAVSTESYNSTSLFFILPALPFLECHVQEFTDSINFLSLSPFTYSNTFETGRYYLCIN